ncbi:hypothetical protein Fmac_024422 [Flemingia macrophylla]|uniref:Hexosyltransferase n=1 Tax=Flemingia macrophylla TaxID=520843 RepID=A0ABD1LPB7_9FABA
MSCNVACGENSNPFNGWKSQREGIFVDKGVRMKSCTCILLWLTLVLISLQSLGSARTDEAYVTLLYGDEFLLGVRVLGKSIRDTGSIKDMVVLVSDGVSNYANTLLQADGWIVEKISLLANPNQVRPKRFWGVYTKLKIFNMTDYKKVVYLDADTIVVKNIEELFKCGKFCANLKHSERLNSGVMVVQPSATVFNDMISKVKTLPSYTGGDQGFLNSYYSGFPNAHVFEPNLTPEMLATRPVPEMERLSTLYNADVGLYMLANKGLLEEIGRLNELEEDLERMEYRIEAWVSVDEKLANFEKILLEVRKLTDQCSEDEKGSSKEMTLLAKTRIQAIQYRGNLLDMPALGGSYEWQNGGDNKTLDKDEEVVANVVDKYNVEEPVTYFLALGTKLIFQQEWMVDENELRVIHYTLGPLKPWDWWTSWLVKPVDVWQNVRVQLKESLPGTGGGRNPTDNFLVKFLFLLPFCAVLTGGTLVPAVETLFVIMSDTFITGLNQGYHLHILPFLPQLSLPLIRSFFASTSPYLGIWILSHEALAYSFDDWLINGAQYKVPAYLGSISVCICLLAAVLSLGSAFVIVPRQVAPWTGLLLMYEWTFAIFFILFGGYINLIYHWGKIMALHTPSSSLPGSSDEESGKIHQRQMSSCDTAPWFYGLGMAFLAIAAPSLPCLFGITALFLRFGLMVVGGIILASFMTYSSEHLAIRSFLKGFEDKKVMLHAMQASVVD